MRTGNTELLRSFYVSLLGVVSLMMGIRAKDGTDGWRGFAVISCFFLLSACAAYLTMRHYQGVETFKNQRYATFLLKGSIVLSAAAFIIGAIPLLSHL